MKSLVEAESGYVERFGFIMVFSIMFHVKNDYVIKHCTKKIKLKENIEVI